MAKIGLAFAAGIAGFLLGGPLGAQIGFAIGGIIGAVLFPTKLPPGPRVNDLQVSSATDGAPIPFGYGLNRIAGNVIWAPPFVETVSHPSVKGAQQTNYNYAISMAVAFGEGPGTIRRIWFDSKIVYDSVTATSAPITGISQNVSLVTVQSTLNPPVGTQVNVEGVGHGYNGLQQVQGTNSTFFTYLLPPGLPTLGAGGTAYAEAIPTSYVAPTIYPGTQTQNADPNIQANEGAAATPAFRGLIYCVWEKFPLADFGNRIPTVRAEVTYGIDQVLIIPSSPGWGPFEQQTASNGVGTSIGASITPSAPGQMALWFPVYSLGGSSQLSGQPTGWSPILTKPVGGSLVGYTQFQPTVATLSPTVVIPNNDWVSLIALFGFGPSSPSVTVTKVSVDNITGIMTVTCANGFAAGSTVYFTGMVNATFLNGVTVLISTANSAQFTAPISGYGGYSSTDSGTATWTGVVQGKLGPSGGAGSGTQVVFDGNVSQGNTIVFIQTYFGNAFGALTGLNDNQGNSYNIYISKFGTFGPSVAMGVAVASASGPLTITTTDVIVVNTVSTYALELYGSTGQQGSSSVVSVPVNLQNMVTDLCVRSGLEMSDVDVTPLAVEPGTSPVTPVPSPLGYVVGRPSTAQSCLQPLAQAFFFDGVESGGLLRFVPRGGTVQTLTIPESDLGLVKDKYEIVEQIGMAQDLPREIQVIFNDPAIDYQQNKVQRRRKTRIVHTRNQTIYELPMTITATEALQIAEEALFLAWLERKPYDTNLWKSLYMLLDPTDIVQFTYEGLTFQARVVKTTIGGDFTVAMSMVNEDQNTYQSSAVGSSGTGVVPAAPQTRAATIWFLLDIPLLQDSDANPSGSGYYFAVSSSALKNWPGATLESSSDNANFGIVATDNIPINYGTALSTLAAPRTPWDWDTVNTLTVFMTQGTLTGTSDLNVLNGANALLVGKEIIQYVNSVQNADGSFTVSRLLRGRRGTDVNCGTHGPGETVLDLSGGAVAREQVALDLLQVLRYYVAVTYGAVVDPTQSTQFTDTGNDLRPYAPASLAGSRDGSGNLTFTWIRRTRIGGAWLDGIGIVPLSEQSESYDVEIVGGGGVVRTFFALASPTVAYTAAQQITDFGETLPSVTFNVYQNSASIGRGFKATATV